MRIGTFFYLLRQGIANIWRNKLFSLASVATMTACIFLFGVFYSIGVNFSNMVDQAEEGVSVTVYFDDNITQNQIDDIGYQISIRPEVSEYRFVSAEEAWQYYKDVYFKGKQDLVESFGDINPLANSSNYEIKLSDVSKQNELVTYLEGLAGVRQVNKSEEAARVLTDFNALLTLVFVIIIIILIAVAVFLINNTITVGISVRSEEIAIMKLIGARDSFVCAPFIIEGITIGFIGAVLPLILMYFMYGAIMQYVAGRFSAIMNMFTLLERPSVFTVLLPVSLILGVGIGLVGSRLAIRRHLKV